MEKFLVICVLGLSSSLAILPLLESYNNISISIDASKVQFVGESMVEYIDEGLMEVLNLDEFKETGNFAD